MNFSTLLFVYLHSIAFNMHIKLFYCCLFEKCKFLKQNFQNTYIKKNTLKDYKIKKKMKFVVAFKFDLMTSI